MPWIPRRSSAAERRARSRELANDKRADLLLVLNDLRPRQRRNLEKIVPLPIVDRTMLILDVFARHARSREGKVQVELAQLRYRQSNLIGAGAELSRLGGGIGTRGPGETKLEVDRRRIGQRIATLNVALRNIRRQRALRRSGPQREPLVALVGYTNVGKSSLLNALTHSDALVADRPFATLDPTIRRAYLAPGSYVRLADTVGFITDLPKELVDGISRHARRAARGRSPGARARRKQRAVAGAAARGRRDSIAVGAGRRAGAGSLQQVRPRRTGSAGPSRCALRQRKDLRGSRFAARGNPSARGSDQRCEERLIAERSPIHEIGGIAKVRASSFKCEAYVARSSPNRSQAWSRSCNS